MRKWICFAAMFLLAGLAVADKDEANDLGWGDAAENAEPNPTQIKIQEMLKREADALKKSGRCSSDEWLAVLCEQTKDIITFCERTWKGDFSTQQECEEWQRTEARYMSSYLKLSTADERRGVVVRCMEEWAKDGLVNWGLMHACIFGKIPSDQLLPLVGSR